MNGTTPSQAKRIVYWALFLAMVLLVGGWFFTRDTLPSEIRIAAGTRGGLYHRIATAIAAEITRQTGTPAHAIETHGSGDNRQFVVQGKAELAILQSGAVPLNQLEQITPLYYEPILIVTRASAGLSVPAELVGRRVILGPMGSGMQRSSQLLLDYYGIETARDLTAGYFKELATKKSAEAAIVTTGLLNPDLQALLTDGQYRLMSVPHAEAIAMRYHYLKTLSVPEGFFRGRPPVPPAAVKTVATMAVLVCHEDATALLVKTALAAIYESGIAQEFPILIPSQTIKTWSAARLHDATKAFFDPYGGIGLLASFMESFSGIKELVFALGAALYLLVQRYRREQARRHAVELQRLKDRLDAFLERTVAIEKAQMETQDVGELSNYLDAVTKIKIEALEELTHEDLRGDNHFAIFLMQCANLIRKIQSKIQYYQSIPSRERQQ